MTIYTTLRRNTGLVLVAVLFIGQRIESITDLDRGEAVKCTAGELRAIERVAVGNGGKP